MSFKSCLHWFADSDRFRSLRNSLKIWWMNRENVMIDRSCWIERNVMIRPDQRKGRTGKITVGSNCELSEGVQLAGWGGSIRLADRVFLGPYVVIYGHGGVEVGEHTLISMHCCILSSDHKIPGCERIIRNEPSELLPVKIGKDVWLGSGVKVLGGVTIGDGCVVGAGAIVSKDLPPYSVAVGVPAKVIRYRV